MSTIALDYGSRYIGVAISDVDNRLALRHSVIDQKKVAAIEEIKKIVEGEKIGMVVVGLPVSLSGKPSEQTHATVDFIEKLRQALPREVQIDTADETLTSHEAEARVMAEGGSKNDAHAEAARLILEEYLRQ